MTVQADASGPRASARETWFSRSPEDVAGALGVDAQVGLSAPVVAERLKANGPNALPEEKPKPGWLRFVEQYRSYMQIILVVAALVSVLGSGARL